jgi:hypothetical protein
MLEAISRLILAAEGKHNITRNDIIILAAGKMDEKLQTFWHNVSPIQECFVLAK